MTNTRTAGRLLTRPGPPQLLYLRIQSAALYTVENHARTFGALTSCVPCATARHNLATSFTRALLATRTHHKHSSSRHHVRVTTRPSVLCIRSTMSNSQRISADFRPLSHAQFSSFCRGPVNQETGGAERDRTDDLLLAKQALSQLSYGPHS